MFQCADDAPDGASKMLAEVARFETKKKKIFIRLWISINPRLFVSCFEFIYAAYLCRLLRPHGIYLLVHPLSSKFTLFLNANKMII